MSTIFAISALLSAVCALPPPITTTARPTVTRNNGLINDVKEINLFLNIPRDCGNVYDGLIRQLEGCRSGSDHGDPRLTSGCLLHLDFTHLEDECSNTALYFPAVVKEHTPPQVPCNGTYCPTTGKLIFSGDSTNSFAFPGQEEEEERKEERPVNISDLLGSATYGTGYTEEKDGPRMG